MKRLWACYDCKIVRYFESSLVFQNLELRDVVVTDCPMCGKPRGHEEVVLEAASQRGTDGKNDG